MKLFDLLKSLNNGTAIDPDARAEVSADNHHLLDELHNLLALLDAPAPSTSTQVDEHPPTLNLATIFEDTTEMDPARPGVVTATAAIPPYRPVVRELLDEFLPMLTQTLGERLDQLDDITLQQWRQAIAQRAGESEPAAE